MMCCKRRKVVAMSEHTGVFDCVFVRARIEHSNAVVQKAPWSVRSTEQSTEVRLSFRTLHG